MHSKMFDESKTCREAAQQHCMGNVVSDCVYANSCTYMCAKHGLNQVYKLVMSVVRGQLVCLECCALMSLATLPDT